MKLFKIVFLLNAIAQVHTTIPKTIIADALAFCQNLPVTNIIHPAEVLDYRVQLLSEISQGNYEKSFATIMRGLEKYPHSFTLQTYLAELIDDLAELYEEPFKNILKTCSKKTFEKLMSEVDQQPKLEYYQFKIEYFFRFALYREQYESAVAMMYHYWNTPEWYSHTTTAYYHQAIGATYYAKELLVKGNKKQALSYAQAALVAWSQFLSRQNSHYSPYVDYALALGILGYKHDMICALQRSAELINKDLTYHDFQEVIQFINGLEQTK